MIEVFPSLLRTGRGHGEVSSTIVLLRHFEFTCQHLRAAPDALYLRQFFVRLMIRRRAESAGDPNRAQALGANDACGITNTVWFEPDS